MSTSKLSCKLIPGLFNRADRIEQIAKGFQLQFTHHPGLISELASIIEQEQDCCSFLHFELSADFNRGAVVLKVTGPEGTAQILHRL